MAQPLQAIPLNAPGRFGLNTEEAAVLESPEWSLQLDNGVIDSAGRVAARKGWKEITDTNAHASATESIFEYVKDKDTKEVISAGGGEIYEGTDNLTTVTDLLTPTNDNWQFHNFNGKCIGVQAGENMIVYTGTTFADISGTASIPDGDVGLSAFGRMWVTDTNETTLRYCDLLDETEWDAVGAGSLDTLELWPDGVDVIKGLAEFQDRLLIFGRRSILVFVGPEDPSSSGFQLEDIIDAAGTIARDSIVSVGNDILYLARDGLRSMARGIAFSNLPLKTLSRHVRTELIADITKAETTSASIKCAYSRVEGAYLAKIGTTYWYFDVKQPLEDGALRPSKWQGIGYDSLMESEDGTLYLGQTGVVAQYTGYKDGVLNDDTGGDTYRFRWRGAWLVPFPNRFFLPKLIGVTLNTPADYFVTARWGFDFRNTFNSEQRQLPPLSGLSEWAEDEYSGDPDQLPTPVAEWSGGAANVRVVKYDLSGEGERLSIAIDTTIDGSAFGLQKIDLFGLPGRVAA